MSPPEALFDYIEYPMRDQFAHPIWVELFGIITFLRIRYAFSIPTVL